MSLLGKLSKNSARPPLEGLYAYALAAFAGFIIADLTILNIRPEMLPQDAPPARPKRNLRNKNLDRSHYNTITRRNIFNSDGQIPPALTDNKGPQEDRVEGPATLSQLPLRLLGTMVHANPKKSVGTIFMNNRNKAQSVKVDEELENIAQITKIERRKVTFRNLNNRRLEYIEIPEDSKLNFAFKTSTKKVSDVDQRSENDFVVKRSDLEKYTSNLSSVLKQARVVPNIPPGSGGAVQGFRFVSIQPNSIYEKLGFKPGDVLKAVNGEAIDSPTKGMELYNTLKYSSELSVGIERDGRDQDLNYTIE